MVDLLTCWNGNLGKSVAGRIWNMIPHCLMWCLWCERNARIFNEEEKSVLAIKFHVLQTLLDWLKASHQVSVSMSLSDMIDLCSICI